MGFALPLKTRPQDSRVTTSLEDWHLKENLHRAVIERLEDDADLLGDEPTAMRARVRGMVGEYFEEHSLYLPEPDMEALTKEVLNELTGYGPLEPLLADETIDDILINGPDRIFIECQGKLCRTRTRFINEAHVMRVVRRMLAPLGRRLDESSPMVDARLPDGSRVNAIIPPLALDGPCVSIRKFHRQTLTADDLIRSDAVSPALMNMMQQAVAERRNILISGATGSGKTTLLNVLSTEVGQDERVVTIEDAAELQLNNVHVVRLETRAPNSEGEGEVTARQLVKNALRMRPDRVILGESRGDEALDMLQAMNTGHLGSMSTLHSNSAQDALTRLQMMVRLAGFQGTDALINQIIATALDVIVHVTRDAEGHRHVVEVDRVMGLHDGKVTLTCLYHRREGRMASVIDWEKTIEALV